MEQELLKLRKVNTELKKKLDEGEKQHEAISARLFSLERLCWHQLLYWPSKLRHFPRFI